MKLAEMINRQEQVVFAYLSRWMKAEEQSRSRLKYRVVSREDGFPLAITDRDGDVVVEFDPDDKYVIRTVRSLDDMQSMMSSAYRASRQER